LIGRNIIILIILMVYLYSIISGFRAILGSTGIQMAMAMAVLLLVRVPKVAYRVGTNEAENEDLIAELSNLWWMMIAVHLFCFAAMLITQYTPERFFEEANFLSILAMLSQVINITRICSYTVFEYESGILLSREFDIFKYWLMCEVVVFAAGIFGYFLFLLIRSFVIQKITLKVPNLLEGAKTDYLESQAIMGGIFVTFVVPAGVLLYIN